MSRERPPTTRLPNAAGAIVPNRVRIQLPILFAARFAQIERIIFSSHDNGLITGLQQVCDIGTEWCVTAFMPCRLFSIDPQRCNVVDCAEVNHQALATRQHGRFELSAIPTGLKIPMIANPLAGVSGAKGTRIFLSTHLL